MVNKMVPWRVTLCQIIILSNIRSNLFYLELFLLLNKFVSNNSNYHWLEVSLEVDIS